MHIKTSVIGIIVIILAVTAVAYYAYIALTYPLPAAISSFAECSEAGYPVMESFPRQCMTLDGKTFVEDIGETRIPITTNEIRVASPKPNTPIQSPLSFHGEARGRWYFEASFPVELLDANGKHIGQGIATAETDWMTEEFVPFSGTISWQEIPGTSSGTLRFHRDNPSGIPEYDASVDVPIIFQGGPNETETHVLVFFANTARNGDDTDCNLVFPVKRSMFTIGSIEEAALKELLGGPTEAERAVGFETLIPEGVRINTFTVENGVARVDFSDELSENVAGSCRVVAMRAQIEATLKQFPAIKDVVISVSGKTETALQP